MKNKRIKDILLAIFLVFICGIIFIGLPIGAIYVIEKMEEVKVEYVDDLIVINNGDLEATITNGYYLEEKGYYYVEGILKNNTKEEHRGVYLNFYVYDKDNNILGEATSYLEILQGNSSWKFKAEYDDKSRASEVASYKLISVEFY